MSVFKESMMCMSYGHILANYRISDSVFHTVVFLNVMKTKGDPFKMEITTFQKC